MKRRSLWLGDVSGAVAPTVALALFALIGATGIAFDYARLASLDTELQNAADQAALAAATQLDGETGACARAAAAAAGLLANETLFANDATASRAIVVQNEAACDATGSIQFYQSYDQNLDTFGPAATSEADARVVLVRVNPREAVYALTPVVGAFRSGNISAEAVAALGSAICKVPPVMMCNPAEPDDNTDVNLDFSPDEGDGLRLVIGSPDAPGNFGFLRTGEDAGAQEVAKTVGYDNPPSGCFQTNGVETEPGNMISVRAALNTRFDISENGALTCPDSGTCSASRNSRKDLVRARSGGTCNFSTSGWHESTVPYRAPNVNPLSAANPMIPASGPDPAVVYPNAMGYPRDLCHAVSVDGVCTLPLIGNGDWDIDAYFQVNYGWNRSTWMANTFDEDGNALAATAADVPTVSRYDVYKWEMANPTATIDVNRDVPTADVSIAQPVCRTPGITPGGSVPDRRRVAVAVVNCIAQGLRGHEENVQVRKWLDVFLVEPAIARGNGPNQRSRNGDIYSEVISVSSAGGTETAQVIRRDVPYLIR
jgi:Flp pilus assembly protein TadG